MTLAPGKKVYVKYNPVVSASFVEILTITKFADNLLFFQEKPEYYCIAFYRKFFYGYSYSVAGNVLVTHKHWLLPVARIVEKARRIYCFVIKQPLTGSDNQNFKDKYLSYDKKAL